MMVAVAVLMIVSGTVFSGILRMTNVSTTVSNRTEMHSGVRNANELLQQEVGQAGLRATGAGRPVSCCRHGSGNADLELGSRHVRRAVARSSAPVTSRKRFA